VVSLRVVLDHFHRLQLLQTGFLGNLVLSLVGVVLQVAYVRDVADITHFVAQVFEQTEQNVIGHAGTGVTQMGVSIHGGAAHVHSYVALVDGLEKFLVAGKGICEV
jgi:hypothetical protein